MQRLLPVFLRWGRHAALLALLLAGADAALAQTGKIQCRVTDGASGEGLPGVNVVIEGTTQGTATDVEGHYVIVGVRPGTYTLVASYLGYQTTRTENVRVQIDLTAEIDITLREEVIQGEEVVVVAQRPLVQKDMTATTAVVSGDEIRTLPVENFSDVVNLQAGVVDGHFRGGRSGEVGYWIDGIPVTDVYSGNLGVAIENSMVQELQVVTGAFNAEYGQAMSGIVNVVTREGGERLSGGFSGFVGDYASARSETFQNIGDFSPFGVRNAELDLSGPLLGNRLTFFTSGRYFKNEGHLYGRRAFDFGDVGVDERTGLLALRDSTGSGDSSLVAMNPYEKVSGQAKLSFRVGPSIRFSLNALLSQEDYQDYNHELRFLPQANLDRRRWGRTLFAKWTHTLSNRTFYEAGFTNSFSAYRHFLFEDVRDERYQDNRYFDFRESLLTSNFRIGGTDNARFDRSTDTYLFKIDLTSQVDNRNLVKVGVEARRHDLEYRDQSRIIQEEGGFRFDTLFTNGEYRHKPVELAAYAQDKIEIGSLIINAGLRLDYFDASAPVIADPSSADIFLAPDARPEGYFGDAEAKWQVSPRIGVAFPITERGVVHFSYGHFFQVPNFEYLYLNPYFRLGAGGSGLVGLVGNANLEPQKTINGEIGLKQQLTEGAAVELTAYFRDIRNLAGTATDPVQVAGTSVRYGMVANSDFGFVRGVVLRFDQRVGDGLFLNADYTFQIAKGNASDPNQVYQAAANRQQLEQQILPLNWDQLHTLNISTAYRSPGDWGFGLIFTGGSGLPYTPVQSTTQTGIILPTRIPLNSERRPLTYNVDLNAYKDFVFGRHTVQLFGKVDNLLDTGSEVDIFGDTGRATYSLQKNVDARNFQGDPAFLDAWYTRPNFFSQPRRVVLGLSYRF